MAGANGRGKFVNAFQSLQMIGDYEGNNETLERPKTKQTLLSDNETIDENNHFVFDESENKDSIYNGDELYNPLDMMDSSDEEDKNDETVRSASPKVKSPVTLKRRDLSQNSNLNTALPDLKVAIATDNSKLDSKLENNVIASDDDLLGTALAELEEEEKEAEKQKLREQERDGEHLKESKHKKKKKSKDSTDKDKKKKKKKKKKGNKSKDKDKEHSKDDQKRKDKKKKEEKRNYQDEKENKDAKADKDKQSKERRVEREKDRSSKESKNKRERSPPSRKKDKKHRDSSKDRKDKINTGNNDSKRSSEKRHSSKDGSTDDHNKHRDKHSDHRSRKRSHREDHLDDDAKRSRKSLDSERRNDKARKSDNEHSKRDRRHSVRESSPENNKRHRSRTPPNSSSRTHSSERKNKINNNNNNDLKSPQKSDHEFSKQGPNTPKKHDEKREKHSSTSTQELQEHRNKSFSQEEPPHNTKENNDNKGSPLSEPELYMISPSSLEKNDHDKPESRPSSSVDFEMLVKDSQPTIDVDMFDVAISSQSDDGSIIKIEPKKPLKPGMLSINEYKERRGGKKDTKEIVNISSSSQSEVQEIHATVGAAIGQGPSPTKGVNSQSASGHNGEASLYDIGNFDACPSTDDIKPIPLLGNTSSKEIDEDQEKNKDIPDVKKKNTEPDEQESPYNPEAIDFGSPVPSPASPSRAAVEDDNVEILAYKDVVAFNDIMKSKVKHEAKKHKRKKLEEMKNELEGSGATKKEKRLVDYLLRQAQVEELMKNTLKHYFKSKEITKEEYKSILKKAVPQVTMSNSSIIPEKIESLMQKFVRKCKGQRAKEEKEKNRRKEQEDLAEQQKELERQLKENAAIIDSFPLAKITALNPNLPLPPM